MQNTTAQLSFLDASTLQLRLELGSVARSRQTTVIPQGVVEPDGYVYSDGQSIGRIGGPNGAYFHPFDRLDASPIADLFARSGDSAQADLANRWIVTVNGERVGVDLVSGKSNILDTARVEVFSFDFAITESVFLQLDRPISAGANVTVRLADPDFTAIRQTFDPARVVTEAIHVNLRGFDPDDAHKVAHLSSWNGWRVDAALPNDSQAVPMKFTPGTRWSMVDSATGRVAERGVIEMGTPAETPQRGGVNFQGTDVWKIDFSDLSAVGTYHIVVEGVGRSNDFTLSQTHWDGIHELGMLGYYHQRSGIALAAEHIDCERPPSLHPDDGLMVQETDVSIPSVNIGYDLTRPDVFAALAAGATGDVIENAWGGWHDAGDRDRRTQHIEVSRKMIELWKTTREYQGIVSLSIPESGDGIPDLLNAAMWKLDLFQRLQQADGGVRGGIESGEHPCYGEGSWSESLPVYANAADAWTSWEYAAAVANLSGALQNYDPVAAAVWRESTKHAMTWAEANRPVGADYDQSHFNSRNLAAAELYNLTGTAHWHNVFKATTSYDGNVWEVQWFEHQFEAALVYARTTRPGVDFAIHSTAREALLCKADFYATQGNLGAFGSSMNPWAPYGWGISAVTMEEAADIFFRTAMAGDVWPSYLAAPVSESFQAFEYFAASAEYNVMQTMDSLLFVTGYLAAQGMNQAVRDGPHADVLRAANGGDIVLGAEGADSIHGGYGDDRIAGGRDDDWLHGGRGDASLFGDQGSDWLFGGDGNDVLAGGSENDSITGGRREDRLLSGDGGDNLWGGFGNDTLLGGDGDDRLVGGAGNDILDGGSGNETLISGLGADMFIFGQGSGRDTMSDFAATEDRIRIDTAAGTDSDAFLASGTFRADRFGFTLDLRGGGRLLIVSQAPLTLQQLTFSMELI